MTGTGSDANRSDPTRGAPAHSLSRQYESQHITQALAARRAPSGTGTRRRENRIRNTLLAFGSRHPSSRKVFVLGNGRAGTHWVGRVLDDHPAVSATIEKGGSSDSPRIWLRTGHVPAPTKSSCSATVLNTHVWRHSTMRTRAIQPCGSRSDSMSPCPTANSLPSSATPTDPSPAALCTRASEGGSNGGQEHRPGSWESPSPASTSTEG